MTTITEKTRIISDYGDGEHPNDITIEMDGTQPDCPITFWVNGKAVFSMACHEVDDFCKALNDIAP